MPQTPLQNRPVMFLLLEQVRAVSWPVKPWRALDFRLGLSNAGECSGVCLQDSNKLLISNRLPGALHGNADGLQPRTLEIWKSYGILEEILSKGAAIHAMV